MAAQLSTSFVLETLIHAKEKPTMLQWIELLTKQFNSCHSACEWFLNTMAEDDWWPQQILIKCPNQMVRQMFQRLLIHVINQLKTTHSKWYLYPLSESDDFDEEVVEVAAMGNKSCVTRFIKKMLAIIDHGSKPHCKYLTEYFAFLHEFAKMGSNESQFLLRINAISVMVTFFMSHKAQENYVEIVSDDDDDDDDDIMLTDEKYRPQSLEKMIALIAMLVDKSRGVDKQLHVSQKDYHSIVGGKGFPFLYNQIRDCINIRQTCNLIFSLCRWNERLAVVIVQMIFGAISRLGAESQPFFKLLSMLVEFIGGPPGMPSFTRYVLQKFWEAADYCPQQCLEWLAIQVTKNKFAHAWTLQNLDAWVEPFLLAHNNVRVRNSAAYLLIALVPSSTFRQAFRTTRSILSPHKDLVPMGADAVSVLHEIYSHLLRLLARARQYVDASTHGTTKLVPYFAVMNYCLLSRTEKQMFSAYFLDLWQLFQPKLSEPPVSMHHNKQALLVFWHQVCVDCPDNVKLIVSNAHVTKNIAFNYILADHEDQDVVLFNRAMLPAYYGILRMCCQQSRPFTRQLAQHQNMQWAFKNITPYPAQYTAAVDELFKMMRLMIARYPDMSNEEWKAIAHFKRSNIQLYLQNLDSRTSWQTLITALKILVENTDDKLLVLQQRGLPMLHEAFNTLHVMHHEATACHVTGDIIDLLSLTTQVLKVAHQYVSAKKCAEVKPHLSAWKERVEFAQKLLTLLNSFTPPEVRRHTFDVLREMVLTFQNECLQTIVPVLVQAHRTFQDNNLPSSMGPYFPKRGQTVIPHKTNIRPSRPQFQMFLHSNQLEASKGVDEAYDQALSDFFFQYHHFVDLLVRVAVNQQSVSKQVVNLSAMVAYEGVPLHAPYFAKLWYEIYQSEQVDKDCVTMLCNCSSFIDYVDAVLLDERQSLNNQHIYQFFCNYFPKVYQQVLNEQCQSLMESLVSSIAADRTAMENVTSNGDVNKLMYRVNGDLRALLLIFSVQQPQQLPPLLLDSLHYIQHFCRPFQQERAAQAREPSHEAGEDGAAQGKAEDDDTAELPAKRRKTISGNSTDDTTATEKPNSPVTDSTEKPSHDQGLPSETSGGTKPMAGDPPRETTPSNSPKQTRRESESSPRASTSQDSTGGNSPQPSTSREGPSDFPGSPRKKWRERSPSPFAGCLTGDVMKSDESKTHPTDGSDSDSEDIDAATKSSDRRERSVPKQKPTMLDMVIKNTELIFNMLKKRV
ncbi:Ubiquitin carboxyl-terminal hydrolase 34 [Lamellibrachia satsuma]|nr:Ubiquitin carboxyl-terminal hydrolase 34 [Lamellibrachia satsuma]